MEMERPHEMLWKLNLTYLDKVYTIYAIIIIRQVDKRVDFVHLFCNITRESIAEVLWEKSF